MAFGCRQHFVEPGEELLGAVILAFDFLHQARPFASPGRRCSGIVEQRAQRETRGLHLIVWNAGGYRAAFETVDLFTQPRAQPGRIGMA